MGAYLNRIRLTSLFACAATGLYFLVAKARGRDFLLAFLLAFPNLLLIFFPASWVSSIRGIALAQSLAFVLVTGFGSLLGVVIGIASRTTEPLVFVLLLVFLSQLFLLRSAAQREPSAAAATGGPGGRWVLFSAILTVIYQAYVYEFVFRRK